jgi:hypothetical protein
MSIGRPRFAAVLWSLLLGLSMTLVFAIAV